MAALGLPMRRRLSQEDLARAGDRIHLRLSLGDQLIFTVPPVTSTLLPAIFTAPPVISTPPPLILMPLPPTLMTTSPLAVTCTMAPWSAASAAAIKVRLAPACRVALAPAVDFQSAP